MLVYFSPLACSLATRIVCYEAGAIVDFQHVNRAKRLPDGSDYLSINPLGLVPALRTDTGQLLTENAAVLQWVADQCPDSSLAPRNGVERAQVQQWLSFLGTEIHRGIFGPLLDRRGAPEGAKEYARSKIASRFGYLEQHLAGRAYLAGELGIADAYLMAILNWTAATNVPLSDYRALSAYYQRNLERPSVKKANEEERALYAAEEART